MPFAGQERLSAQQYTIQITKLSATSRAEIIGADVSQTSAKINDTGDGSHLTRTDRKENPLLCNFFMAQVLTIVPEITQGHGWFWRDLFLRVRRGSTPALLAQDQTKM